MLTIRWDVLVLGGVLVLTSGYLVVQALLRVNVARLLEALGMARCDMTDEPCLYELFVRPRDHSPVPSAGDDVPSLTVVRTHRPAPPGRGAQPLSRPDQFVRDRARSSHRRHVS